MRQLISVLAGVAFLFSTISASFAEIREFEECTYDGNLTAHGEFLAATEDRPTIAVHGQKIGAKVECEDDTEFGLRSVIVYTTFGVIAGAAIGVSIAFFALTSNSNSGVLGITEYLQSRGQNTFELNPLYDFDTNTAGLKFDINF